MKSQQGALTAERCLPLDSFRLGARSLAYKRLPSARLNLRTGLIYHTRISIQPVFHKTGLSLGIKNQTPLNPTILPRCFSSLSGSTSPSFLCIMHKHSPRFFGQSGPSASPYMPHGPLSCTVCIERRLLMARRCFLFFATFPLMSLSSLILGRDAAVGASR